MDPKNYNFVFNLSDYLNVRRKQSTFLEINLFDVSVTKTNMIFRGTVLIQLSEVPTISLESDLNTDPDCRRHEVFTKIPTLPDSMTLARGSFEELSKRKDERSKKFVEFQEKCRNEKRLPIMPFHGEWA